MCVYELAVDVDQWVWDCSAVAVGSCGRPVADDRSHLVADDFADIGGAVDNRSHFVIDDRGHFVADDRGHFVADDRGHFVADDKVHYNTVDDSFHYLKE